MGLFFDLYWFTSPLSVYLGKLSVYAFVNSAIWKKLLQSAMPRLFTLFIGPVAELECQRLIDY